ncbi:MAG: hypothetical protein SangKO_059190 [Sandaracinaceae bacterium]|mgnify:FL=1
MRWTCLLALVVVFGCDSVASLDGGTDAAFRPTGDDDGDGIANLWEGEDRDSDADGTPDRLDLDSDDDGVSDAIEGAGSTARVPPPDSDGDGRADFVDTDSDGNGILDGDERDADTDGDGRVDRVDEDDDGDLMPDARELEHPEAREDTDGDGLVGLRDPDSDGDTIRDGDEPVDAFEDGTWDLYQLDSDADGFPDAEEAGDADPGTAPADSDGDGVADFWDLDSDADGLLDADERALGTRRDLGDTDADGYDDRTEVRACPSFDASCASDATDPTRTPMGRVADAVVVARGAAPDPDRVTFVFELAAAASELRVVYADGERDPVDTRAAFVDHVALRTDAGPFGCEAFGAADTDADGHVDTFRGAPAGATVCVELVAAPNDSVAPGSDASQIFLGFVRLVDGAGDGVDYQGVAFRVPRAGS